MTRIPGRADPAPFSTPGSLVCITIARAAGIEMQLRLVATYRTALLKIVGDPALHDMTVEYRNIARRALGMGPL